MNRVALNLRRFRSLQSCELVVDVGGVPDDLVEELAHLFNDEGFANTGLPMQKPSHRFHCKITVLAQRMPGDPL